MFGDVADASNHHMSFFSPELVGTEARLADNGGDLDKLPSSDKPQQQLAELSLISISNHPPGESLQMQ